MEGHSDGVLMLPSRMNQTKMKEDEYNGELNFIKELIIRPRYNDKYIQEESKIDNDNIKGMNEMVHSEEVHSNNCLKIIMM